MKRIESGWTDRGNVYHELTGGRLSRICFMSRGFNTGNNFQNMYGK